MTLARTHHERTFHLLSVIRRLSLARDADAADARPADTPPADVPAADVPAGRVPESYRHWQRLEFGATGETRTDPIGVPPRY
jgi:hypothetical protein